MLCIDAMTLRLPPGYEHRAAGIARLVGEALAQLDLPSGGVIDRVQVGKISVSAGDSDAAVAKSIAAGVAEGIRRAS